MFTKAIDNKKDAIFNGADLIGEKSVNFSHNSHSSIIDFCLILIVILTILTNLTLNSR